MRNPFLWVADWLVKLQDEAAKGLPEQVHWEAFSTTCDVAATELMATGMTWQTTSLRGVTCSSCLNAKKRAK